MKIIEIQCTYSDFDSAQKTINHLVSNHFIACGNIVAAQSIYEWNNKIMQDSECLVFMKTSLTKKESAINEIIKLHSYELPSIIHWEIETTKAYGEWVEACVLS